MSDVIELYSDTCDFDELAEPDREYPVLVKVTTTHVLWVMADSPAEAEQQLAGDYEGDVYDSLNPQNSVDSELDVTAPDKFDIQCGADSTFHADGPRDYGRANEYGPWRPGEPQSYRWRTWSGDAVRFVERDMAEALAKLEAKAAGR